MPMRDGVQTQRNPRATLPGAVPRICLLTESHTISTSEVRLRFKEKKKPEIILIHSHDHL